MRFLFVLLFIAQVFAVDYPYKVDQDVWCVGPGQYRSGAVYGEDYKDYNFWRGHPNPGYDNCWEVNYSVGRIHISLTGYDGYSAMMSTGFYVLDRVNIEGWQWVVGYYPQYITQNATWDPAANEFLTEDPIYTNEPQFPQGGEWMDAYAEWLTQNEYTTHGVDTLTEFIERKTENPEPPDPFEPLPPDFRDDDPTWQESGGPDLGDNDGPTDEDNTVDDEDESQSANTDDNDAPPSGPAVDNGDAFNEEAIVDAINENTRLTTQRLDDALQNQALLNDLTVGIQRRLAQLAETELNIAREQHQDALLAEDQREEMIQALKDIREGINGIGSGGGGIIGGEETGKEDEDLTGIGTNAATFAEVWEHDPLENTGDWTVQVPLEIPGQPNYNLAVGPGSFDTVPGLTTGYNVVRVFIKSFLALVMSFTFLRAIPNVLDNY